MSEDVKPATDAELPDIIAHLSQVGSPTLAAAMAARIRADAARIKALEEALSALWDAHNAATKFVESPHD